MISSSPLYIMSDRAEWISLKDPPPPDDVSAIQVALDKILERVAIVVHSVILSEDKSTQEYAPNQLMTAVREMKDLFSEIDRLASGLAIEDEASTRKEMERVDNENEATKKKLSEKLAEANLLNKQLMCAISARSESVAGSLFLAEAEIPAGAKDKGTGG